MIKINSAFFDHHFQKILIFLFLLSTFFWQRFQTPIIILMLVGLFFSHVDKSTIRQRISIQNPSIWFVLFFILHLLGLIYSDDLIFGLNDISMKLAMLAFPIYFLFSKGYSLYSLMNLFTYFGCVSVLICLGIMSYKMLFLSHNVLNSESEFSFFLHRGYQAIYWCIGFFWCLYICITHESKYHFLVLAFILLIGTFFTFSKAGIICLVLGLIYFLFLLAYRFRMYKIVVASILFIISTFISINLITPKPAARLNTMFNSLFYGSTEANDSNNVRLLVWSASIDIIKKEPFTGVGTGDVKNSLRIRNIESGNHHLAEKEYNSHNQFLNTGVALGIPGLIILIVIILLCLKYMNRNLNPVWIIT